MVGFEILYFLSSLRDISYHTLLSRYVKYKDALIHSVSVLNSCWFNYFSLHAHFFPSWFKACPSFLSPAAGISHWPFVSKLLEYHVFSPNHSAKTSSALGCNDLIKNSLKSLFLCYLSRISTMGCPPKKGIHTVNDYKVSVY